MNNDRVELLDNARLKSQLGSLQRKTRSQGRDVIDNFLPGGHDDCANAVAMGCVSVAESGDESPGWVYHLGMKEEPAEDEKPVQEKEGPNDAEEEKPDESWTV